MDHFLHIIADPAILNGKPIILGTRISVELILKWLASGATIKGIALKHPLLNPELVEEAIRYAARFNRNEILIEVRP